MPEDRNIAGKVTKAYTNKDLKFPAPPQDQVKDTAFWSPSDPEWAGYDPSATYGPEQSADDILAEAKATYSSPRSAALSNMARGLTDMPERAAALSQDRVRMPTPRQITETIATPAPYLGGAALATGMTGIGAGATPVLGGAAGMFAAPDVLRRMIMPEEDESRGMAAAEGGLYATGLAPVRAGLRSLFKPIGQALSKVDDAGRAFFGQSAPAVDDGAELVKDVVGTARDYMGKGMSRGQAGQRAGWPLGKSTSTDISGGPVQGPMPLRNLMRETEYGASRTAGVGAAERELSDASNLRGAWGGDRTVGPTRPSVDVFGPADDLDSLGGVPSPLGPSPQYPNPAGAAEALRSLRDPSLSARRMQELLERFGGAGR